MDLRLSPGKTNNNILLAQKVALEYIYVYIIAPLPLPGHVGETDQREGFSAHRWQRHLQRRPEDSGQVPISEQLAATD